ncbi:MAG: nuclear transport factor 2 family protein [Actinomycetota bacterium]|nr:nuclear transport factor 2 family protein [Actinomycetota bacterium]
MKTRLASRAPAGVWSKFEVPARTHARRPGEAKAMTGEMTAVVQRMFDALDKGDMQDGLATLASDALGIDEISRKWMRTPNEVRDYVEQLMQMTEDVHSEMHDVHEIAWDDTGVVTFWLEQDYTLRSERAHISAPTTVVLRREEGAWKIALFHSIPLPPES